MPNNITNVMMCRDMNKLFKKYLKKEGDKQTFSFENVIPMPEYVCRKEALSKEDMDGPNWYDWSVRNWGTKWDAYDVDVEVDIGYIRFDTAWNTPIPIFRKLSTDLGVPIYVVFADEDISGNNSGALRVEGTQVTYVDAKRMYCVFVKAGSIGMMNKIDVAIDEYEIGEILGGCV